MLVIHLLNEGGLFACQNFAARQVFAVCQLVALRVQRVLRGRYQVEVEGFDRFPAVGAEGVELVENRDLGYVAKRGGACLGYAYS